MKRDTSNTWITGAAQAEGYVSSADVIIIERQRTMKLLGDIFGYHFGSKTALRVLDLGGGEIRRLGGDVRAVQAPSFRAMNGWLLTAPDDRLFAWSLTGTAKPVAWQCWKLPGGLVLSGLW